MPLSSILLNIDRVEVNLVNERGNGIVVEFYLEDEYVGCTYIDDGLEEFVNELNEAKTLRDLFETYEISTGHWENVQFPKGIGEVARVYLKEV